MSSDRRFFRWMSDERRAEMRAKIEALFAEFIDVVAPNVEMPVIGDWVLVVTHDSIADATLGRVAYLKRANQWSHQTVGLLTMACDDFRHLTDHDEEI